MNDCFRGGGLHFDSLQAPVVQVKSQFVVLILAVIRFDAVQAIFGSEP
jgi:hypothetical protein